MTTASYRDCLRSGEWRVRSHEAHLGAGVRCQIYNRPARRLDAHHRTYARFGHERPDDLITLCRRCHDVVEEHCVL